MTRSSDIERNVKTIAALGGGIFLTLTVALIIVQSTLGKSINDLSNHVVPIQRELGQLSDAVSSMFLRQSEVVTANSEELRQLGVSGSAAEAARRSPQVLQAYFAADKISNSESFPREAANRLDAEVERFLSTSSQLYQAAAEYRSMSEEFIDAQSAIEGDLQKLLRASASIAGVLRLNHVIKLRNAAQELRDNEVSNDSMDGLIHGDTRIQMEAIDAFNLAALHLNVLAGKIALAENGDLLNSLTANQISQNRSRLIATLNSINTIEAGEKVEEKLFVLNSLAMDLISRVGDKSSVDSLVARRYKILEQRRAVREIQHAAGETAELLKKATSDLMAFSERFAHATSRSAENTIMISRSSTFLISFFGVIFAIIAALRVRRSVFDLRLQNKKLSDLSESLAEINSGLEKAVQQRTESLQHVLDSTGDGIIAVDLDGKILPERSQAVLNWFGTPEADQDFWSFVGGDDTDLADNLEMGFDQIVADIFPFEVAASQAPSRIARDGQVYSIEYKQICESGEMRRLLILVRDITAQLEAEKAEQAAKDLHKVISNLLNDKDGFLQTVAECEKLIVDARKSTDLAESRRILHTIKGNSAIAGFRAVAECVHELEDKLADLDRLPTESEISHIESVWQSSLVKIQGFLDRDRQQTLGIDVEEVDQLLHQIESRATHQELLSIVRQWKKQSTKIPLHRLAQQAGRVADKQEKQVELVVNDGGVRLSPERLQEFWPTMVHVVRNAVDHGLEETQQRMSVGKPEKSKLVFATEIVDNCLEVSVRDDGRGIDWQRVREKATAAGIPNESYQDLVDALFHDGLTTRDAVSEVSGRGVGLSSVRVACSKAGGSISVESESGVGTRFVFKFPVSEEPPVPGAAAITTPVVLTPTPKV